MTICSALLAFVPNTRGQIVSSYLKSGLGPPTISGKRVTLDGLWDLSE
jgi:hypothetical protein